MIQALAATPIPVLIRRITVPASVCYFSNTMFNAVDTRYGGRISTQALGSVYLFARVRRTILMAACRPGYLGPRLIPCREIARQGVPAAANLLTSGPGIFVIMRFGTAAVFLFAGPLMAVFTADRAVIAIGRSCLKISAFILYASVVLSVSVAALQGIGKPMIALWIGLWRQIVAPAAVFWLFTRLLGVGLTGIWWGIFGITWSAAAAAWLYARRQLNKAGHELTCEHLYTEMRRPAGPPSST